MMKGTGWLGVAALAAAVAFTSAIAQEKTAPAQHGMVMPDVDQHLKILSAKLDLSAEQQEKARPILIAMQDAMQKDMDDKSLTPDQMHAKMHSDFMKADGKLRTFLGEEQKTKLNAMEAEMHHGKQGTGNSE